MPARKTKPLPDMQHRCGNCRHFGSYEEVECCKRYPPIPLFDGEQVVTHYPVLPETELCGEWGPILSS